MKGAFGGGFAIVGIPLPSMRELESQPAGETSNQDTTAVRKTMERHWSAARPANYPLAERESAGASARSLMP